MRWYHRDVSGLSISRRDSFFLAAAALAGCGAAPQLPPGIFPTTADGGWKLVEAHDLGEGEAPDPVPRSAILRVRTASYKGPGELEAHIYLLDAAATGETLAQRWRPSADTVFFDKGPYFVVVRWQDGDRRALQSFVAELQRHLDRVVGKR